MTNETRPVFDPAQKLDVLVPSPEGTKKVTVSHISDEQFQRRKRSQKVILKELSRGASETEITPNESVDLQILAEIRESGADLDGAEAGLVLDRISEAEATDAEREGPAFRVTVRVPGAITTHV